MRYVSIDLETTGLNPETSDIIEFGAVIDDLENPKPIKELAKFHTYVSHEVYVGSAYAFWLNSVILEKLAHPDPKVYMYTKEQDLAELFRNFLQAEKFQSEKDSRIKITAAGKNFASFDLKFLTDKNVGFQRFINFHHRCFDPGSMYFQIGDKEIPATGECKKRAGLSEVVAHNSIDDALDVIRLIRFKVLGSVYEGGRTN